MWDVKILHFNQGIALSVTRAASANHSDTYNIPRENPEEWPPCLLHKLHHGNRAKDWRWIPNKTFEISTFALHYQLQSNEANYIHLNARFRLKSSCIQTGYTVPHGGHIEGLCEAYYGRQGLDSPDSAERSI